MGKEKKMRAYRRPGRAGIEVTIPAAARRCISRFQAVGLRQEIRSDYCFVIVGSSLLPPIV